MKLQYDLLFKIALTLLIFTSCTNPKKDFATMIIHGGTIYTVVSTRTSV